MNEPIVQLPQAISETEVTDEVQKAKADRDIVTNQNITANAQVDFSNPRCLTLITKADQSSTLLSAPTLTASIDEEGEGQVALSYDLMNLASIQVNKRAAIAQCKLNYWLDQARALQKFSARNLAREGLLARVAFVDKRLSLLEQFRKETNEAVSTGSIKLKAKSRIFNTISRLLEVNNNLRRRAQSQDQINFDAVAGFPVIEHSISNALELEISLKQQSDLARNVRFTLSGGVRLEREEDRIDQDDGGGFGRANLSIRLGAFSPAWQQGKLDELHAEIERLYEPGQGILWQIANVYQKNRAALSVLKSKRSILREKLARMREFRKTISPNKLVDVIFTEVDLIRLRSELVEIDVNIGLLHQAQRKLSP